MKWRQVLCVLFLPFAALNAAERVEVRLVDGDPALVVDGTVIPPHMFFNATSDRRLVADSLARSFASGGIRLHQLEAVPDWSLDFGRLSSEVARKPYAGLKERLRALVAMDPNVLVLLRVRMSPQQNWAEIHPDDVLTYQDGTRIFHSKWTASHSYASKTWRQDASERLAALIEHLQQAGLEEHILGYLFFVGWSGEWNFFRQARDELSGERYAQLTSMAVDHSPAMRRAFRVYLREKYQTDARLRAAWQDPQITLDSADPPTEEEVYNELPNQLNPAAGCAKAADYFACNAKEVADSLLEFARVARTCSPNRINGAFFGAFLFAHIGGNRSLQRGGHADIDRVLAAPDIDFICSPQSYQSRRLGGHSPSMCLVDSAKKHGKLVWYEFDQPTHLATDEPGAPAVAERDVPRSLAETVALMRRGFGYALTNRLGIWWWDQAGRWGKAVEGGVWYRDPAIRSEFALYQRIWTQALADPERSLPRPEIAVIYDPRACFRQQSSWRDLSYDLIYRQVDALGKMGAPYELYSLGDLDKIEGHKLYIVLNAFDLDSEQVRDLKRLTRVPGVTTLWFYAPGYLSPNGAGCRRVSELTGAEVSETEIPLTAMLTPLPALNLTEMPNPALGRKKRLQPTLRIDGGRTLAVYEGTTIPAATVVRRDGWQAFLFASAPLPAAVLRHVVAEAGCHRYTTDDDVIYTGRNHIVLHTAKAGTHTVRLPVARTVRDAVGGKLLAREARQVSLECSGPKTWILAVSR